MGLFRFSLKSGILGGAVYYSKTLGVWDDSSKTYELSQKIIAVAKPYLVPAAESVQKELPASLQVKNLPSTDDICRSLATNWNNGVMYSVSFLGNIPDYTCNLMCEGFTYVTAFLEKQKIISIQGKSS